MIAREHGQAGKRLRVLALTFLSNSVRANDPVLAQSQYDEAWAIVQELDETWLSALLLHQRAHWYEKQNDYSSAGKAFEDSMNLFHTLGDKRWETILLFDIASKIYYLRSDYTGARRILEKNLSYFRETRDRMHISFNLSSLAEIEYLEGNYELGKKYWQEDLELGRELGSKLLIAGAVADLGFCAIRDGELDSARLFFVESLALGRELGQNVRIFHALAGFGCIAVAEKRVRRAVQIFGTAETQMAGTTLWNFSRSREATYNHFLAIAREQLDQVEFNAAWDEGRAMTLEQAIEYALHSEPALPAPKSPLATYPAGLTEREVEVLRWLARGLSNQEIADKLVLSKRTVHAHLRSIYGKLDVTTRSAATRVAVEHKIV